MSLIDSLKLEKLGYFYAPPLGDGEIMQGWYKKNNTYFRRLVLKSSSDSIIQKKVFEELKRIDGVFPEEPEGSFAKIFICRLAVELASAWDVPFLCNMLFWDSVLNHRDNSYISIILGGIQNKGHLEDVSSLELFRHEICKPERLFYKDGDGLLFELPGIVRLRQEINSAINTCKHRGSIESEAARISGGYAKISGFLWPGAGRD